MKTVSILNNSVVQFFKLHPVYKKIAVFLCAVTLSGNLVVKAQEPIIPENYTLIAATDFRQYETALLSCTDWLIKTPRNKEEAKRKKAEDFVVKWVYGCTYLSVIIEPYAMKLSTKNADLLVTFILGYTEYKLKNLSDKETLQANLAGLNRMIVDYKMNKIELKADPAIDEIIKLQEAGTLAEWVKSRLTLAGKETGGD